ncbi:hypothetical protein PoB_003359100 [Plakobranchus ocellatus]|uniref:Uncharacterized protein n=1 Tax=Plakobranchus ocellatus TaxID=259542 RepID=A0AAV4AFJ9_9GAST|nr:hypothetical protein PoB_003359100 [Plakobranchus ocellatus]
MYQSASRPRAVSESASRPSAVSDSSSRRSAVSKSIQQADPMRYQSQQTDLVSISLPLKIMEFVLLMPNMFRMKFRAVLGPN